MKRVASVFLSVLFLLTALPMAAVEGGAVSDSSPDYRYTLLGASWDPEASDGEIVEKDGQYAFHFERQAGKWMGIGDPEEIFGASASVTYEYEILFETENLNDRCFLAFGDQNGWHGVSEGGPQYDEASCWVSGNGFASHGHWGAVPAVGEWGTVSLRNDQFDPAVTHHDCITQLGSWTVTGDLYLRSVKVYDNADPERFILLRFNQVAEPRELRYTLEGASFDPEISDGEILLFEDRYAFRFAPGAGHWMGIGDPTGILSQSVSVTYEYEVYFDTDNGNDRCFIEFADTRGWHGVSEGAPEFDEEGYWVNGTGFVLSGSWGPVPPAHTWGTVSIRNDHYDPAVQNQERITLLGSWVSDGDLYIRSVRVYDNQDESKYIALQFNDFLGKPAPRYTLDGASFDPAQTDGEILVRDGFNVYLLAPPENKWIGIGDPDGILSESTSVTYEYEILFETENLNDRCFLAFGDTNGWHSVSEGAAQYDEDGYWQKGNGFVAHGSWGTSPEVGQWGTVSLRNDHFDPSVTHRGWITGLVSWMGTGELYVRSVKVYDNDDPDRYISLQFNEDLNELVLTGHYGVKAGEKEGYPVWVYPMDFGYLAIDTDKLLADGTLAAGTKRFAIKVSCWLEETDSDSERLGVWHHNPNGSGYLSEYTDLCEHRLDHSRLTRRGRWCQYKFLFDDGIFYGDNVSLLIAYETGAGLYIRGVEVYAADKDGARISQRPARWGTVEPDPELSFKWADNGDGESVTINGYTGGAEAVEIPEYIYNKRVTAVGNYAFFGNAGLKSVLIPDTVAVIGDYAFGSCTCLSRVELGTGIRTVGVHAFSVCTGLTDIRLPEGLVSIGKSAFYGCEGLSRLFVPNTVDALGDYAFAWCAGLTDITLPDTVASIGNGAFNGCDQHLFLYCPADSAAHRYAEENGIGFILIRENGINKMDLAEAIGEETDLSSCNANGVAAYEQALETARNALRDPLATQGEIDDALTALTAARAALIRQAADWGDVDGDGDITSTDARLVLQLAVDKIGETDLSVPGASDVDGDGRITSTDARLILQKAVGKTTHWPPTQD